MRGSGSVREDVVGESLTESGPGKPLAKKKKKKEARELGMLIQSRVLSSRNNY